MSKDVEYGVGGIFDMSRRACALISSAPCPGFGVADKRTGGCPWWRKTKAKMTTWEGKNRVEHTEDWIGCGVLMRDVLELGVAQNIHNVWQAVDDMVKSVERVGNILAGTQLGLAEAMGLKVEEIQTGIKAADRATLEGRRLGQIGNGMPPGGLLKSSVEGD